MEEQVNPTLPKAASPVVNEHPKPHRSLPLDVLRGVAILLVIGRHGPLAETSYGFLQPLAQVWFRFGWTGVDLFFVLSGFLIGGLLFNEIRTRHDLDAKRFLIRRGFKIYPSYFAFMAGATLLARYRQGIPFTQLRVPGEVKGIVINTLSLQNYFGSPWGHTWSLAVEEHFYILLPFALLLAIRWSRRHDGRVEAVPSIPKLALVLIAACTLGRIFVYRRESFDFSHLVIPTHLRIDSLFFGVFLAYLANYRPDLLNLVGRWRHVALLLGLLLIAPMTVLDLETSAFVPTIGFTFLYLGYGCILLFFITAPANQGLTGFFFRSWVAPRSRLLESIATPFISGISTWAGSHCSG